MMPSGFTLSANIQDQFFDRAAVIDRMGAANARRLSRIGAYIRRRARTNILRRRKGVSSPGSPPSVHSKDSVATLRNIQFAADRTTESMICGPIKLNQVNETQDGRISVPEVLEKGGTITIYEQRYANTDQWYRQDRRRARRPGVEYRKRAANYAARPFMGPALKHEIDAGTVGNIFAKVG